MNEKQLKENTMQVQYRGLSSSYEVEHLVRIFFPSVPVRKTYSTRGTLAFVRVASCRIVAALRLPSGKVLLKTAKLPQSGAKEQALRMLYDILKQLTGINPPWGMLTGVRPVRLLRRALAKAGEEYAKDRLFGYFDVSPEKYELVHRIETVQRPILATYDDKHYSLYVSIPYCPSRCAYCSFVSRTMQRDAEYVQDYLACLEQELAQTALHAKELGLTLASIYVGGGTPTALSLKQLEKLLASIAQHFNTQAAAEYTVEAGRPDCTDFAKLALLKQFGVGRISINPQTMQDEVLEAIGRGHTAADILRCFDEARRAGHDCINMDLIAGLPKDSVVGFTNSLKQVLNLKPENITVHTLTLKRASNLVIEHSAKATNPALALEKAYISLEEKGYEAYYLYRQKNTTGNFENTGWALPKKEGLYNICIMEELQSIFAVGAGAVTKLVNSTNAKIERIYNHKYPAEYIEDHASFMYEKQRKVRDFYVSNVDTETTS